MQDLYVYNPKPKPPLYQTIMGQIGMVSGLANMAMGLMQHYINIAYVGNGITNALGKAGVWLQYGPGQIIGKALSVIGIALSEYSLLQTFQSWFQNGFNAMGLVSLASATVGIATGINILLGAAAFSGPIGWIVAGISLAVMALVAGLMSIFGGPSAEEKGLTDLNQAVTPVAWSVGPIVLIAASTAAVVMGWPRNQPQPVMSGLTISSFQLSQKLAQAGNNPNIPIVGNTPTLLVDQKSGQVMIVTATGRLDNRGSPMLEVKTYNLNQNIQFVSAKTPQKGYIPFFNPDGSPNPDLVKVAIPTQQNMLHAALDGGLTTAESINAINIASAADKYGVDPID